MNKQSRAAVAAFQPFCGGEGHRDADDPQEERKNQVGERPPIPLGVVQLFINVVPGAGVVHEHHRRDGGAAKNIKRHEATAARGRRFGRCGLGSGLQLPEVNEQPPPESKELTALEMRPYTASSFVSIFSSLRNSSSRMVLSNGIAINSAPMTKPGNSQLTPNFTANKMAS